MFDVGFAELFLLSLIGLLVLGPERLPAVARTLGGFVRKARISYHNLKRTVEAELAAAEVAKPIEDARKELESVQDEVRALRDQLNEDQTATLTATPADAAPAVAEPVKALPGESERSASGTRAPEGESDVDSSSGPDKAEAAGNEEGAAGGEKTP